MGCAGSKSPAQTQTLSGGHEVAQSTVVPTVHGSSIPYGDKVVETEAKANVQIADVEADRRTDQQRKTIQTKTLTEPKSNQLTILHFNDVYNIEPREKEPVGGAARFATKLASFKYLNPLVVFSGDCLNPSMMSSVTRGKQMIPVLNALNVNVAVLGNHDFDFGVDELLEFCGATKFPWLLSNVIDNLTGRQLAEGKIKWIVEWGGRKIGFIGLVEEEWLVTLATIDREEVTYIDFVTEGTKLAKELRDDGAEFVIALTHMRVPNDCRLAQQATGIDLILGGHDHDYFVKEINGVHVVKSGTDFRELSVITVNFSEDNNFSLDIKRVEIISDIPEDADVKLTVDSFVGVVDDMMEEVIGEVEADLDGRFSSIRTKETNLGNFVTDIIQNVTEADVVILNSGTLRSDTIHHPGVFKMKDLASILPMPDVLVVLELTGEQVLRALENGVSQWPKLEGRFPQVAGIRFTFNPKEEPGSRVMESTVCIDDELLDKHKKYKVCTKLYLANGKDGYQVFTEGKVLIDEENGPILTTIVRNHFRSINIVRGVTTSKSPHRQSLVMRRRSSDLIHDGARRSSQEIILSLEKKHTRISPQVEGRINILTEESQTAVQSSSAGQSVVEEVTTASGKSSEEEVVICTEQVQQTESQDHLPELEENENATVEGDTEPNNMSSNETKQAQILEEGSSTNDTPATDDVQDKKREESQEDQMADGGSPQPDMLTSEGNAGHTEGPLIKPSLATEEKKADEQGDQRVQEEGGSNTQPQDTSDMTEDSSQLVPDMASEDDYWDLWEAVKSDDIEQVKTLRQDKNIRFTRFQDNKTILHLGAERNAVKVVEYLLTEGKLDPNVKDEILQGVPLHGAAEYGSVDAARILLQHGAELNKQDLIANSALHIACEHNQGDMKTFLVDQGADTTLVNSDGEKPAL